MPIGIQNDGTSSYTVKNMAFKATGKLLSKEIVVADIGCGRGELARELADEVKHVTLVDHILQSINKENCSYTVVDLNDKWPLPDNKYDLVYSLEVIEHIENPRHFFREITRIVKPDGFIFITTPNNLNFFSKLFFLFTGIHRFFQDSCYPAHISVVTPIDIKRICQENNLTLLSTHYNHHDVLPLFDKAYRLPFSFLSDSIGFLIRKS